MNINDAISRLPIMLRGRFAASNNATWIAWACDAITQIERVCAGPGQLLKCQAWQMASGFVPKPSPIWSITNAWLDGEPVPGLQEKERRGFAMESMATCERHAVQAIATEYGCEVIFDDLPTTGTVPAHRTIKLLSFDGVGKTGSFQLESGSEIPIETDSLVGWVVVLNGESLHIKESSQTFAITTVKFSELSDQTISGHLSGVDLLGVEDDALDGCEVHIGHDLVTLQSSSWQAPISTRGGWTVMLDFQCDRAQPGRAFSLASGYLVKSNLIVEGYRSLARPTTLTEELDLPEGSEVLLASYLRMRAEQDMEIGSRDALAAKQEWSSALARYSADQTKAADRTAPSEYRFNMVRTGRRP